METIAIGNTGITTASRIALGTWAIGGWMWGGTDEQQPSRPSTPRSIAASR